MAKVESETATQLITASYCFDGQGQILTDAGVAIAGRNIVGTGTRIELETAYGDELDKAHYPGCTLLPGLIDAHTHLILPGDGTPAWDYCQHPDEILLMTAARNAWLSLRAGFTTVVDLGARGQVTFRLRDAISQNLVMGPRLLLCGRPLTIRGGHCWPLGGEADGVDGLRQAVRQLCKEGADFIKVMATGGGTPGTNSRRPAYSFTELEAIVTEAHARDRRTIAHSGATEATSQAVDAGFDGIAHCHFQTPDGTNEYDEAIGRRLQVEKVWVNPTLQVNRVRTVEPVASLIARQEGPDDLCQRQAAYTRAQTNFQKLRQAGVSLICGSDSGWGWMPFGRNALEIEAMVEAGMTVVEALVASTSAAANALGWSDRIGSLQPDKLADLLVVKGNATEDIGALADVVGVWREGRSVEPSGAFAEVEFRSLKGRVDP